MWEAWPPWGILGVMGAAEERCHSVNPQAGMGCLWGGFAAPCPQHGADPYSPMDKDSAAVLSPFLLSAWLPCGSRAAPDAALTLI